MVHDGVVGQVGQLTDMVFRVPTRIFAIAGKICPWVTRMMVTAVESISLPLLPSTVRQELLLRTGLVGQRDAELRRDPAAHIVDGVPDDEVPAGLLQH